MREPWTKERKPEAPAERKQLTVAELIRALSLLDPAKAVLVEGCDCVGEACGVSVQGDDVLIERRP